MSQYVQLHTDQLDFKIKRIAGNDETVIWSGDINSNGTIGNAQNGGEKYIQSVNFTAKTEGDTTGKLDVTFNPSYILESDVRYEISYNLEKTNVAQSSYEEKGYDATGDDGTDYGTNTTSSGNSGFHSNKSANFTYFEGGGPSIKPYPHLVIQVKETPKNTTFTVTKKVDGTTTDTAFQFKATISSGSFQTPGSGDEYTLDESGAAVFALKHGESITLPVPNNTKVTITELNHDGFTPLIKQGDNVIANGDSASVTIANSPVEVKVVNTVGYEIPSTGGSGTLFITLCGLGLIAGALVYRFFILKNRGRRVV